MLATLRSAWRNLRKPLWIATTPLALTLLMASPGQAASPAPAPGSATSEAHAQHEVIKNPIQNFAEYMFNYHDKDTHGGVYGDEENDHKMPPPFSLALVNFGALLFIIGKYAAPSFARMVNERHNTIATQLAESTRLREEAEQKLALYTKKIDGLQGEIDTLVASLRSEAAAEKTRLIAEAGARAERMKHEAEQQIQVEIARVKAQLEREVVQAAMAVAEKILREKATETDQRALTDRFVKSVQAAPAAKPRGVG